MLFSFSGDRGNERSPERKYFIPPGQFEIYIEIDHTYEYFGVLDYYMQLFYTAIIPFSSVPAIH